MGITLLSTTIISFISSIIGGALPIWRSTTSRHFSWMHQLDALCDGVFIGIACTHLLPELYEHASTLEFSVYAVLIVMSILGLRRVHITHSKERVEHIVIALLLSHCFFEGLAVSLAKHHHVQASLSAAILAHKVIESFVFLNLITRRVQSRAILIAILPLFAALTPAGILAGIWLQNAPDLLINIITAVTCGAFISLGSNCVLLSDCHEHAKTSSLLWMAAGIIFIAVVL